GQSATDDSSCRERFCLPSPCRRAPPYAYLPSFYVCRPRAPPCLPSLPGCRLRGANQRVFSWSSPCAFVLASLPPADIRLTTQSHILPPIGQLSTTCFKTRQVFVSIS